MKLDARQRAMLAEMGIWLPAPQNWGLTSIFCMEPGKRKMIMPLRI